MYYIILFAYSFSKTRIKLNNLQTEIHFQIVSEAYVSNKNPTHQESRSAEGCEHYCPYPIGSVHG